MPQYQAPTSDEARLAFLETASKTATTDLAAGRKSITPETLAGVKAFVPVFRPLYEALTKTLAGRMKEVREREEARAVLDTYVRDFWEVLKRRAHRMHQPAEILAFYGLAADGNVPDITTFEQLVTLADGIVTGETSAVAAGYPAMANPSAAEVAAVLANARTQAADVPGVDRTYSEAQVAIAAQRAKADELLSDIMDDLRSSLRRFDAPTQRRIMRGYGATFTALPGEPTDPTPEPAPTPTPTPPTT